MKNLNYQLKQLCKQNRDGSYATQDQRSRMLSLMANQLYDLGYRKMTVQSLKPKHVEALTQLWERQGIAIGTRKNRLAALRWWAKKIGKQNVVGRDNAAYGIGSRVYVSNTSKAQELNEPKLAEITDPYVQHSIRLQAAFGLRREESIKIWPAWADQGDHIRLKGSWTKGGKPRTVPITTDVQRQVLDEVKAFAKGGALIPPDKNYVQQRNAYVEQLRSVGLKKLHGLRHAYAQRRYKELTGWKAPAAGGPASKSLDTDQRALDRGARELLARELGHERESISAVYLGR